MTLDRISMSAEFLDLSPRITYSTTVAASPSAGTITTIANLTLPNGLTITRGVLLFASAQYTVGTSGVSVLLDIKRSTTVLGTSGAITQVATQLGQNHAYAFDTAAADGQAYVLAMTVASGAATSTVSSVLFGAIII